MSGKQEHKAPSTEEIPSTQKSKKRRVAQQSEILEKGLIYFFYRPKVGVEKVEGFSDVQRFYILLWPQGPIMKKGSEVKSGHSVKRLIILAKKQLPDVKHHGRYWGFVDKTATDVQTIVKEFGEKNYETKTRGERHVESARPAGEGVYAIVKHGDHTHLAYVLEQPETIGEVQKAFHVDKEGSYVLAVKNPESGTSLLADRKPKYPENLVKAFTGKTGRALRFASSYPVDLLDYEGAELIFIGASENIVEEFGKTGEELEEMELRDAKRLSDDKLFTELHMDKKKNPPEPLLKGIWK